jgi:hypothetical protein
MQVCRTIRALLKFLLEKNWVAARAIRHCTSTRALKKALQLGWVKSKHGKCFAITAAGAQVVLPRLKPSTTTACFDPAHLRIVVKTTRAATVAELRLFLARDTSILITERLARSRLFVWNKKSLLTVFVIGGFRDAEHASEYFFAMALTTDCKLGESDSGN